MSHAADPSHPRYESLLKRALLEAAARKGMLADSALIAHGRGEAFDYLLGEVTIPTAIEATRRAAGLMLRSKSAVISVNGNAAALAGVDLLRCAAVIGCPVEVNIFYRTPERMSAILQHLEKCRSELLESVAPIGFEVDWRNRIDDIPILGSQPDAMIPGLEGPRASCHADGILNADTILVPLEDGDRCEALVAMGKVVIVVDLNPLSRSARMATVTIVDELTRVAENLATVASQGVNDLQDEWNNEANLQASLDVMNANLDGFFK